MFSSNRLSASYVLCEVARKSDRRKILDVANSSEAFCLMLRILHADNGIEH